MNAKQTMSQNRKALKSAAEYFGGHAGRGDGYQYQVHMVMTGVRTDRMGHKVPTDSDMRYYFNNIDDAMNTVTDWKNCRARNTRDVHAVIALKERHGKVFR